MKYNSNYKKIILVFLFLIIVFLALFKLHEKEAIESIDPEEVKTGTVTDIEGNKYNTVIIGNQEWMAENLKTTTYRDGSPIPNVTDKDDWFNLKTDAYAWYNNDEQEADKYGALYNWYTVENDKGLCPEGWRVPTDEDWKILEGMVDTKYEVGNSEWDNKWLRGYDAGKRLKSQTGWYSGKHTVENTDDYGFSALPGGFRGFSGEFYSAGGNGYWWTATRDFDKEEPGDHAWRRVLYHEFTESNRCSKTIRHGYSVRCVRDAD